MLGITRQRCRVRIETFHNGIYGQVRDASPGSDAGCGLKQLRQGGALREQMHHPAAMPGAD